MTFEGSQAWHDPAHCDLLSDAPENGYGNVVENCQTCYAYRADNPIRIEGACNLCNPNPFEGACYLLGEDTGSGNGRDKYLMSVPQCSALSRTCSPCFPPRTIVKLNVGGMFFDVLRTTLTSQKDSMLEAMFSEHVDKDDSGRYFIRTNSVILDRRADFVDKDDGGRYFFDRDGEMFKFVLSFLRAPHAFTLEGISHRDTLRVLEEFDYFQLPTIFHGAQQPPSESVDLQVSNDDSSSSVVEGGTQTLHQSYSWSWFRIGDSSHAKWLNM